MRDEFLIRVKELLARRVAYRCSNPGCRQQTSGPKREPKGAINIGVASHISAASAGGPRYNADLAPAQRRALENGIWLCQSCAKLIDSDADHYDTGVLNSWKRMAENTAAEELEQRRAAEKAPNDIFRKLERLMPDLIKEMRMDLESDPLSRDFVILKKTWSYWSEGHELAYYFEQHPDLLSKLSILQNYGLIYDMTVGDTRKFRMSEELVDYLSG